MTTVLIYRNKRNHNKFVEVHNDGHYHNAVRQYMAWIRWWQGIPMSVTKNPTGDGFLHRWRAENLRDLLADYEFIAKEY